MAKKAKSTFIPCTLKQLTPELAMEAAARAVEINPANMPAVEMFCSVSDEPLEPSRLAVLVSKYWGSGGVKLSVSFMDGPSAELRKKILSHMNAWGKSANVTFSETSGTGQVRIARGNSGYWSYLGTDVLLIPKDEATMNLEGFTSSTSDAEFIRVVRHETGHTLGFPHEHLRKELVSRLDPAKTIAYFQRTYGWSESMTRSNVLTPVSEDKLLATLYADEDSIMCYQLSGECTKDSKPISGGADINSYDETFAARVYPPIVAPPPVEKTIVIRLDSKIVKLAAGWKVQQ